MVNDFLIYLAVSIAAVFVVVNPLTTAFVFMSVTSNFSDKEKKAVAKKAATISTIILISFALLGGVIFTVFGVTLAAFRIAGGIILFGIGMKMIYDRHDKEEFEKGKSESDISVIPLAIPFISGPGSIATVIILTTEAVSFNHTLIVIAAILITTISCYFSMVYSEKLTKYLGRTGRQVVSRMFGLILAVIAVQFIINGISETGLLGFLS